MEAFFVLCQMQYVEHCFQICVMQGAPLGVCFMDLCQRCLLLLRNCTGPRLWLNAPALSSAPYAPGPVPAAPYGAPSPLLAAPGGLAGADLAWLSLPGQQELLRLVRPPYSYSALIAMAIQSAPRRKLIQMSWNSPVGTFYCQRCIGVHTAGYQPSELHVCLQEARVRSCLYVHQRWFHSS